MSSSFPTVRGHTVGLLLPLVTTGVLVLGLPQASAQDAETPATHSSETAGPSGAVPRPGATRPRVRQRASTTVSPLERRVQLLTRELALDAKQQDQVRSILQDQREAVVRIWADPNLSPAERGPATRAAEERTADRIRAVLSEDQKKKYIAPQPNQSVSAGLAAGATGSEVEKWLEAVRDQHSAPGHD